MATGAKNMGSYNRLKTRIADRSAKVAVMGMGRVGLPLAARIAEMGYTVFGFDPNPKIVKQIMRGLGSGDVDDSSMKRIVDAGGISASTDPAPISKCDVTIICVPTPLRERRELDLTYVEDATETIAKHMRGPMLVILESTTYPGTTEEVLQPILERGGKRVGTNFFLAHGPERLDPSNPAFNIKNTTKLVGGVTAKCGTLTAAFYESFVDKVWKVGSPRAAEMAKVFENIFRNVNIALVNELAQICSRMGLDVYEVLQAAGTKEFGFMAFRPGPGVGGHCIPLDPYYFLWKSREFDVHPRFVQLALEINENMPYYVIDKLSAALNRRNKCLKDSKVLLLGITYKAEVADVRESPALKIFELLERQGGRARYHDPFCQKVTIGGKPRQSTPLRPILVRDMDCVIITTAHSVVDYDMLVRESSLILDTRYVLKGRPLPANNVEWL